MMICPNCRKIHESDRGKCPHCGADFHGQVREKRAVQPRDLLGLKYRCAHGTLRHQPCPKCERSDQERDDYRRAILADLKKWLIAEGVSKSGAWERAKQMLAALDVVEAQKNR